MAVAPVIDRFVADKTARGIKLPLQRSDHATEGLRRSNQQRIVHRIRTARGKFLFAPGHSKLLPPRNVVKTFR